MHATVWFDGAAKGNPGPAGAGAVVQADGGAKRSHSKAVGRATNNEAEYDGLILGLEAALAAGAERVTVRGDSQLVIRQLEGRYQVKAANLRPRYEAAKKLLARFDAVRLEWVRRGDNADADAAANAALS
ncbi:MAG: ribonuclease HI family protein [Thermoplasmatota archaeon]